MKKICVAATLFLALVIPHGSVLASGEALPDNMVWSCYDVGSSAYVEASAIANALLQKFNKNVRLVPSGTSVGRVMALTSGRASVAFLATEAFFGSQGLYEFGTYDGGPIDMRAVLAVPASVAAVTTKGSGIKTAADLKGKRVSYVVGSPTLNVKMEGYLAYAGLTWDDVQKVVFPSYGAAGKGLIQGNTDAAIFNLRASLMYELESSPQGISVIELPPENTAGWEKIQKELPAVFPIQDDKGAGLEVGKPKWLLGYPLPTLTVKADASPEFVYNLIKSFDETFSMYKGAAVGLERWDINLASQVPGDIPYHEGAIKYLKEKGLWTEKHQQWNDKAVKKLEALKKAWPLAVAEGKAKQMDDEAFQAFWKAKIKNL